jgi:hypothetical protein
MKDKGRKQRRTCKRRSHERVTRHRRRSYWTISTEGGKRKKSVSWRETLILRGKRQTQTHSTRKVKTAVKTRTRPVPKGIDMMIGTT